MSGSIKKKLRGLRRKERRGVRPGRNKPQKEAPQSSSRQDNLFNRTSTAFDNSTGRLRDKLRFSLSLRISLSYAGAVLRALPLRILFLFFVWAAISSFMLSNLNREALRLLDHYDFSAQVPAEAPVHIPGVWVEVYDQVDQRLTGSVPQAADHDRALTLDLPGRHLYLRFQATLQQGSRRYRVRIVHELNGYLSTFLQLGLAFLALDFLLIFWFLRKGNKLNARLLRPLQEIAHTAQNLSGANLSERIHIQGIKNELRDLAVVINAMLDRIEASYNSQRRFVSDASHELRTPIAVIQGYVDLLQRWGKNNAGVRDEAIAAIQSETQSMKDLVENLLFLARHDNRTQVLSHEFFDMRELVEEVLRETAIIAADHEIAGAAMDSQILSGDRAALKQALRIFVSNALKYTPPGGRITLSLKRQEGHCTISVSDTGRGISPEDLPQIFDRFYRAEGVRAGGVEGHGLGLAIARIIVSGHGGKITVRSKPGHGSSFIITLPT